MPAYYWIQLYKSSIEFDVSTTVRQTIEGIVNAGCPYLYSDLLLVENNSLPKGEQTFNKKKTDFDLDDAVNYVVEDLECWKYADSEKKWMPGISLHFDAGFRFKEEDLKRLNTKDATDIRHVNINFWISGDQLLGEKIVIDIDTWEEFVLSSWPAEPYEYNKKRILNIVENICNRINPFYGWLDGENGSFDAQYDLLESENWKVENEFVVVSPQLVKTVSKSKNNIVKVFENGCLLLENSYMAREKSRKRIR